MKLILCNLRIEVWQVFPDDRGYFFWIAQTSSKKVYKLGDTKEEAVGKLILHLFS